MELRARGQPTGTSEAMRFEPTGAAGEVSTQTATTMARRIGHSRHATVGGSVVLLLALVGLLAPWLAPYRPTEQHLRERLRPPGYVTVEGRWHLAGTDQFGRDVLSRLIHGVRTPLAVGFAAALLGALIGLLVGLPAGYCGGRVDTVLSVAMEVQLSMPFILVALAVVALFGPSATNIVLVFALTSWASTARVARAAALSLRNSLFVEAARALGVGSVQLLIRHLVPNALPPVLVVATVQVAQFIIYESAFGFLGLGVPPPAPTWGSMLADARSYLYQAWWLAAFPGLCIGLVALAVNLLGDGLRDVLDPREVDVT